MKIRQEFKIGIAAIIAIGILVVGINYLKGINMLKQGRNYYVLCDNAEGLAISGHVMLNGYQVGLIRSMGVDYDKNKVVVLINVEDECKLTVDSRAEVASDLLGTASIVLHQGSSTELLDLNDTIPGGGHAKGIMDAARPIAEEANVLMPKLDTLITGLNVLINESKVRESLLSINELTEKLNTTVSQLNGILQNDVPGILTSVKHATANLDTLSSDLKDADIKKLLQNAQQSLDQANQLLAGMNSENSTVGKLMTTTELHDQLSSTIASLDSLIVDIKAHPRRYINVSVFGRKSKD
jgi:phospholipid/cholesterol/gamma-HCH transport system substrate-binding protein